MRQGNMDEKNESEQNTSRAINKSCNFAELQQSYCQNES